MKHPINQTEVRRILSYDPCTGVFRWNASLNWRIKIGSLAGGINPVTGYLMIMIHGKKYPGHRLAFLYMNGSFPPEDVDHVNGIREDNRWSNLREATRSENMMNTGIRSNNASGINGVSWSKYHGKWQVSIHSAGAQLHVGYFNNLEDAAKARKDMDRQFGYHSNHGNVVRTWGKK